MGNIVQDIKYALRMIRRAPGFSAAVIVTLMLGIGANAAIFSVLNAVVLRPFPYPAAERLMHVWTQFPDQGVDQFEVSQAEFVDYSAETELFEAMFAYSVRNYTLTGVQTPQRVRGAVTTAGIWNVLGGRAAHGRLYGPEEDRPGNDLVVVLDHGFWQQTFGGDPTVFGTSITLDGFSLEVIGVVEAGFGPPEMPVDFYTPLAIDTANLTERSGHGLFVLGRAEPGVELDAVLAEMRVVSRRWEEQFEHAHPLSATRLTDTVIGDARAPLFLLAGAVGAVLLIACANVAGLLMARTAGRQREIGVRAALGAARGRLVRQVLTEGVLLAGAGGVLGLVLASYGTQLLLRLEPGDLPRVTEVSSDAWTAGFVILLSLVSGLGFAAVPAGRATRVGSGTALATSPRTTYRVRQGFQRLMVGVEVAAAIVLVIGAGLLVRSFAELTDVDPGLQPDNLVATRISLPFGTYDEAARAEAFWNRLADRLEATPGIRDTGIVRALPLRDEAFMERFLREGETEESAVAAGHVPSFDWQIAAPGYFRTLGIPITAGRDFDERDRAGSPRVAIVSEELARRYLPDRNPLGERIRILASNPDTEPFEIVGIAGDVRHDGLAATPPVQIFTPLAQLIDYRAGLLWTAAVAVRTDLPVAQAATALREAVWSVDPELPLARISTMDEVLRESVARPRFTALLLSLFSGLALVLACVGIYGVVSHSVAQRTAEMGIRKALGAQRGSIVALVLREGMAPVGIGVVVGIVGALAASRIVESLLFGVAPTDPVTFVLVPLVLGSAALVAAWIPAVRATRVDPLEALRAG